MKPPDQPRARLTCEELFSIPCDGRRHELIDGEYFVNPVSTVLHQHVCGQLLVQLYEQIDRAGRGVVYCALIDVRLSSNTVVEPDLLVILPDRREIVTELRIEGAPSLVVEILSPPSRDLDLGLKRDAYERHGVPELWLVDQEQEILEQLVLKNGRYELAGRHHDAVMCATIPDLRVELARAWDFRYGANHTP